MSINHRIRADGKGKTKVIRLTARRAIQGIAKSVWDSNGMKLEDARVYYARESFSHSLYLWMLFEIFNIGDFRQKNNNCRPVRI